MAELQIFIAAFVEGAGATPPKRQSVCVERCSVISSTASLSRIRETERAQMAKLTHDLEV